MESNIFTDLIDAIMYAIGLKTETADDKIGVSHLRLGMLATGIVTWLLGVRQGKNKPDSNIFGF